MSTDNPMMGVPGGTSSATVHEAAGRTGALPHVIKPAFPGAAVVARAFPVLCPAGDNLWLHHAIYAAAPGEVLVVDIANPQDVEYGYWGEVMAVAAQARGLAGLIINGGVRDSREMSELGFPVFSAAISIRGTIKDPTAQGTLGESVAIGQVTIRRGDIVVADADGVVVVPQEDAAAVAARGAERVAEEDRVMEQLRAGHTTIELLGLPNHE